jgi:hypothetical protein
MYHTGCMNMKLQIVALVGVLGLTACDSQEVVGITPAGATNSISSCPGQYPGEFAFPAFNGTSHNDPNRTEYGCDGGSALGGVNYGTLNFAYYADGTGYLSTIQGWTGLMEFTWTIDSACKLVVYESGNASKWVRFGAWETTKFGIPTKAQATSSVDGTINAGFINCAKTGSLTH